MKPFKHQQESITFLKTRPFVYDASDAGTGKTLVEIMDFTSRRKKKGGCALILAPKSLLEPAWANDFRKFAPEMKVSVAYAENRAKAFAADADVYITNIDAAVWLKGQKPAFFKKFDTLIIDEATSVKHRSSNRSKAVANIAKHFKYRRLMSGTPNSNGVCDLWHQYFILDGGQRLGKSFHAFRSACCTPQQVGPSAGAVQWTDKPGIEAVVGQLIKDITIRHEFEKCVDIPPNHMYSMAIDLSPAHMAAYQELEAFSIATLKNTTVTAVNGAVLYGKLLQMASGGVYDDSGEYTIIDSGRYNLVMDLVEERKHCVVFFNWVHQRDELIKEAERRGLSYALIDGTSSSKDREEAVRNYQAGFYKVLFAHPQSAGHGLTLTKGTTTIWAGPTHNLEHFLQGFKRIYRIGQTEKTETIVIIANGTKDELVWDMCQRKDMKLKDLLKELVE
jgi:SNF2 family DNA or RNA helicase